MLALDAGHDAADVRSMVPGIAAVAPGARLTEAVIDYLRRAEAGMTLAKPLTPAVPSSHASSTVDDQHR